LSSCVLRQHHCREQRHIRITYCRENDLAATQLLPFVGPYNPVLGRSKPSGRSESVCDSSGAGATSGCATSGGAAPGAIEVYAENIPHGVPRSGMKMLYRGVPMIAGGAKLEDRIQFAFGASFVEVRVHSMTGEIRTPRVVGAYAFGTVVNPKTAESQLMGGQIWGVAAALHEKTEIDERAARYTNDNLAEYLIPVNADVPSSQVIILPEEDRQVNDLGIKGVGELGNVGMNAAAGWPECRSVTSKLASPEPPTSSSQNDVETASSAIIHK
jgi:Molybdopterin-binding domain of aldehyde dehydrogenase